MRVGENVPSIAADTATVETSLRELAHRAYIRTSHSQSFIEKKRIKGRRHM